VAQSNELPHAGECSPGETQRPPPRARHGFPGGLQEGSPQARGFNATRLFCRLTSHEPSLVTRQHVISKTDKTSAEIPAPPLLLPASQGTSEQDRGVSVLLAQPYQCLSSAESILAWQQQKAVPL